MTELNCSILFLLATMLDRIEQTFEHLSKAIVSITISGSNCEEEDRSLVSLLGEVIWPSLTEIIIKDCLEKYVPKTSSQVRFFCFYFHCDHNQLLTQLLPLLPYLPPRPLPPHTVS